MKRVIKIVCTELGGTLNVPELPAGSEFHLQLSKKTVAEAETSPSSSDWEEQSTFVTSLRPFKETVLTDLDTRSAYVFEQLKDSENGFKLNLNYSENDKYQSYRVLIKCSECPSGGDNLFEAARGAITYEN